MEQSELRTDGPPGLVTLTRSEVQATVMWIFFVLVVRQMIFPLDPACTLSAIEHHLRLVFIIFRLGPLGVVVWVLFIWVPVLVWISTGRSEPPSAGRTAKRITALAMGAVVLFAMDRAFTVISLGYLADFAAEVGGIPFLAWFLVGSYSLILSARLRRLDLFVASVFSVVVPLAIFLDHVAFAAYAVAHGLR